MSTWLIDGASLMAAGWHAAQPDRAIDTARRAFVHALFRILAQHKPDAFVVCFDPPTVDRERRRVLMPRYKGNHTKKPPSFWVAVIEPMRAIVKARGGHVLMQSNWEADDLIATLVATSPEDVPLVVASKAQRMHQLLQFPGLQIWNGERMLGPAEAAQADEVAPHRLVELLALTGSRQDGVPGINGVGPKYAAALLRDWTLPQLYQHMIHNPEWMPSMRAPEKVRADLLANYTQIALNTQVFALCTSAPVGLDWACIEQVQAEDPDELLKRLSMIGMMKMVNWIRSAQIWEEMPPEKETP